MSATAEEIKDNVELDLIRLKRIRESLFGKGALNSLSTEDISYYFAFLEKDYFTEELVLSRNNLAEISPEILTLIFNALNNRKITSLYLQSVILRDLDLKQMTVLCNAILNSNINFLDLSRNELSEVSNEHLTLLFEAIAKSSIKTLDLNNSYIFDLNFEQVEIIFKAIKKSKIEKIIISNFPTNALSLNLMFESIADSNIKKLDMQLKGEGLTLFVIKTIFDCIDHSKIQSLTLTSSSITDLDEASIEYLFQSICQNSKITELNLQDIDFSQISPELVIKIFALISNSSIQSLSLKNCSLNKLAATPELLGTLFKSIQTSNLSTLNLYGNNLFSLKRAVLSEIYKNITKSNIINLNLGNNSMAKHQRSAALEYLFNLIFLAKKIISLDLSNNHISNLNSKDRNTIFRTIAGSSITTLNLEGNTLGNLEVDDPIFAHVLNGRLKALNLSANRLGETTKEWIQHNLDMSKSSIKNLYINNNFLYALEDDAKDEFLKSIQSSQLQYAGHNMTIFDCPKMANALNIFNLARAKEFDSLANCARICVASVCLNAKPALPYADGIFNLLDLIKEMAFGKPPKDSEAHQFDVQGFSRSVFFQSLYDNEKELAKRDCPSIRPHNRGV